MLTVTERCNLSCAYCYEHDKRMTVMPVNTAMTAIEHAFQNHPGRELCIQFHGGEPLMAFHEVKEICERTWGMGPMPRPYLFLFATNGTLMKGEIKDWFHRHHKGIQAGLSLDGTPEMHNINRSHSFADIDLKFFQQHWPNQFVKMTVSRETLPSMAEGAIYMQNLGFRVTGNPAYGIQWKQEDFSVFQDQMKKLADHYLEHPEMEHSHFFLHELQSLRTYDEAKTFRWCAAGSHMTCLGMDGQSYACHLFMPSVQKDTPDILLRKSKAQALLNDAAADITHPICKSCAVYSLCSSCYGMNFISNQFDLTDRGQDHCTFSMLRIKASAYLYGWMLADEKSYPIVRDMPLDKKAGILNAIEKIEEALPDDLINTRIQGKIKGMGFVSCGL